MFDDLDTAAFTDSDWAELNKLKLVYDSGGQQALSAALTALAEANAHCYFDIMEASSPGCVMEAIKDAMAERGMTREDLDELRQQARRREH